MALKFLNKKGWHTGSIRNVEKVWKAEQKHEAEQKKIEELRLQIQQEKERSEFRAIQEQAGLVPQHEQEARKSVSSFHSSLYFTHVSCSCFFCERLRF
ncbi:putative CBF1-interacting co-repressor CIR domain-containing protein [Arabidopsis thaliana]